MLTFFCITAAGNVYSQSDSCAVYLKSGNKSYEERYYDTAIEYLTKALDECSLNKEEKIQANKILALSYIGIDDLENAEDRASRIMRIDPTYEPDKFSDDPEYVALFSNFVYTPVQRFGLSAGINRPFTNVSNTYSIYHGQDASDYSEYKEESGFQIAGNYEIRVMKKLWLNAGVQFRVTNYTHLIKEVENTTIDYSENMQYFDIPLSVKYYFLQRRMQPYVSAGACYSLLTSAVSTSSRDKINDIVDRLEYRNTSMAGFFGSAGFIYKLKSFYGFVDVKYCVYPDNVNKEGTRYADEVNVFKYYYIDDDFTMDNLQINAGILFNLVYRNKKEK